MRPRLVLTACLTLAGALLVPARVASQTGIGVGVRGAEALGDFESVAGGRGYGVIGTSAVTGQGVWLSMTTGWTRFPGLEVEGVDEEGNPLERDSIDIYELMLGYGLRFGPARIGVRGGRFFGDGASWGFMPVGGLSAGSLIVAAEWDPRGDIQWWGVTASIVR